MIPVFFWKLPSVIASKWIFWGRKWNAFENSSSNPQGVNKYANVGGDWNFLTNALRNSLAAAMNVFKLPLGDLVTRQSKVLDQLTASPFASLGIAIGIGSVESRPDTVTISSQISSWFTRFYTILKDIFAIQKDFVCYIYHQTRYMCKILDSTLGVGKNLWSTSHVDEDMGFTFSGSFTTKLGKEGNGFLFPAFGLKAEFPADTNNVNLFTFNPKFEVNKKLFINFCTFRININLFMFIDVDFC